MFGSQALETAIGLAAMFFIIATASSAITEAISRMFKKRARDLEDTILEMLSDPAPATRESEREREARLQEAKELFSAFKATSVWQAAEAGSGRGLIVRRKMGASYLSAKSFADAIHELLTSEAVLTTLHKAPSLEKRLKSLVRESQRGIIDVKAGLEAWYDETMGRAEGAYKRWAALVLFLVGLFLAVAGNASTVNVAHDLWTDSATRAAVTEAASNVGTDGSLSADDLGSVADATDSMTQLGLPIGWDTQDQDPNRDNNVVDFLGTLNRLDAWTTVAGWLLTAILVMLGGPFWFDVLGRLASLRSTGTKPRSAAADGTSATSDVATIATARPSAAPVTVNLAALRTPVLATTPTPTRPTLAAGSELKELRRMLRMPEPPSR